MPDETTATGERSWTWVHSLAVWAAMLIFGGGLVAFAAWGFWLAATDGCAR